MRSRTRLRRVAVLLATVVMVSLHLFYCRGETAVSDSIDSPPERVLFAPVFEDIDAEDTWIWRGVHVRPDRDRTAAAVLGWALPLAFIAWRVMRSRFLESLRIARLAILALLALSILVAFRPATYGILGETVFALLFLPGLILLAFPEPIRSWTWAFVIPFEIAASALCLELLIRRASACRAMDSRG